MTGKNPIEYKSITAFRVNEFVHFSSTDGPLVTAYSEYIDLEDGLEKILAHEQLKPELRKEFEEFQRIARESNWDYPTTRRAVMKLELDSEPNPNS